MAKPQDKSKYAYMFSDDMKFLQKAIVLNFEGDKFLALKRPADSKSRPNEWDLPGGNVLYGELHDVSLKREIKEETNLDLSHMKPVRVVTNYEDGIYYLFIGYIAYTLNDDIKITKEHSEYKWVTKEEFLQMAKAEYLIDLVNEVLEDESHGGCCGGSCGCSS